MHPAQASLFTTCNRKGKEDNRVARRHDSFQRESGARWCSPETEEGLRLRACCSAGQATTACVERLNH